MEANRLAARVQFDVLWESRFLSKAELIVEYCDEDEDLADSILQLVEHEQSFFEAPILKVDRGLIEPLVDDWTDLPALLMCLHYESEGAAGDALGTRLFERVVAVALASHLGQQIFDNGATSGGGLTRRIIRFAELASLGLGRPPDPRYKDDRVDLIAHTSHLDGRSANLYVLVQCAAGIRWQEKQVVVLDRWAQYLNWPRDNLVPAIATSHFLSPTDRWLDLSSEFGMLMDRVRIHRAYGDGEIGLNAELVVWLASKVEDRL